jgi:ADP-ribose pyrophosphatase YjhB (NUDIX family)
MILEPGVLPIRFVALVALCYWRHQREKFVRDLFHSRTDLLIVPYQFFQEQVLIAKSIDLLGNPVYSVSCERARGVVWTGRLISLFSIRFEDTAIMSQADVTTERPKPWRPLTLGAGAIVVHEGRVLLVRNIHGLTRGRYLLPAGRINPGELPDQAAVRETLEETSLRVEIEGLMGVRIWVLDDGEHNYFFMFRARLLSPASGLRPNLDEIDDARFFTREEMQALTVEETWSGAIAIALKALDPGASMWPNYAGLSDTSGVDTPERWRIWM